MDERGVLAWRGKRYGFVVRKVCFCGAKRMVSGGKRYGFGKYEIGYRMAIPYFLCNIMTFSVLRFNPF